MDEDPIYPGRFLYQTVPLPLGITRGNTDVELTIAGLGPMWPYGSSFAQMQKSLSAPTRGIYEGYTHIEARFVPRPDEIQGKDVEAPVRKDAPGDELLRQMSSTVNNRLSRLLADEKSIGGPAGDTMLLLAVAYNTPWTVAFHKDAAIDAIVTLGTRRCRRETLIRTIGGEQVQWGRRSLVSAIMPVSKRRWERLSMFPPICRTM